MRFTCLKLASATALLSAAALLGGGGTLTGRDQSASHSAPARNRVVIQASDAGSGFVEIMRRQQQGWAYVGP